MASTDIKGILFVFMFRQPIPSRKPTVHLKVSHQTPYSLPRIVGCSITSSKTSFSFLLMPLERRAHLTGRIIVPITSCTSVLLLK
jgi:hypothetical protein